MSIVAKIETNEQKLVLAEIFGRRFWTDEKSEAAKLTVHFPSEEAARPAVVAATPHGQLRSVTYAPVVALPH